METSDATPSPARYVGRHSIASSFTARNIQSISRAMGDEKTRRLCVAAIAASLVIYAAIVIRDFSGPIGDHVESFLYEYLSYYVSKNLTWTPLPHLDLENDQAFYPFGTNVALQSFCVERDLLFTALTALFGRGPWLQLYYLGGLAIAAYGTWALLRKEHGDVRASLVAIGANLFNFYGAQKYPYHFNMACVHWVTLGIVVDFVIVERLVTKKRVSLALILLRALLVILSFGLELGHIVGYGLTSLLATCVFTAGCLVWRRRRGEESDLTRFTAGLREELRTRRLALGGLVAGLLVFGILYGSIVGQIVLATRKYDFSGVNLGVWWSHPVRLVIPYTPWIHPSQQPRFEKIWGDQAEIGIGSGGAGWFLLALAAYGVARAKKRMRFAALLLVLFLYVVSRPGFDLVRWMPWFKFTRVMSRATVVYSTILALLAIDIRWPERIALRRATLAVLGAVGLLEIFTFTKIKMSHPAFAFDDRFLDHMKKVEALPGEAVLDFPFCILGGNGDIHYLCPYMEKLKSVYALQRFHHKKVIGQYLGRVHPSQTQPFADQGWPKIWDPDDPDPVEADVQLRCLNDREWTFFTDFYEKNDFAGIQLAIDRLPAGCPEKFYERFGQPMGVVTIPRAGHLAFIPRDPSTRSRVDKIAARDARLVVYLEEEEQQVVRRRFPAVFSTEGISGWEALGDKKHPTESWRWATLPSSKLEFEVGERRLLVVGAKFKTPLYDQKVTVSLDGRVIDTWADLPINTLIERHLEAPIGPGKHVLTLAYAYGNAKPPRGQLFAPDDPRQMSVMFHSLTLRADPPKD
jgi:hypothetical protein